MKSVLAPFGLLFASLAIAQDNCPTDKPCEPHSLDPHVTDFDGAETTVDMEGVVQFLSPKEAKSCMNIQASIFKQTRSGHNFFFSDGYAVLYGDLLLTFNLVKNGDGSYVIKYAETNNNSSSILVPKVVTKNNDAIDVLLPDRSEIWVTINRWSPDGGAEIYYLDLHMFGTESYRTNSQGLCRSVSSPKQLVSDGANLFKYRHAAKMPNGSGNCVALSYDGCSSTCTSKGDPHISTFDSVSYTSKKKGFVRLVEGNGVLVAARQSDCPPRWPGQTCNTAGVVNNQGFHVRVEFISVQVLGQQRTILDVKTLGNKPANFIVDRRNDRVLSVRTPNGVKATFVYHNDYMDISVVVPKIFKNVPNTGACGTWNDNPGDDRRRLDSTSIMTCKFDALAYSAFYPDLRAAFNGDIGQLKTHYINYGLGEGRTPCGARQPYCKFDPLVYESFYPDLKAAFNGDANKLTTHYRTYGMYEERRIC